MHGWTYRSFQRQAPGSSVRCCSSFLVDVSRNYRSIRSVCPRPPTACSPVRWERKKKYRAEATTSCMHLEDRKSQSRRFGAIHSCSDCARSSYHISIKLQCFRLCFGESNSLSIAIFTSQIYQEVYTEINFVLCTSFYTHRVFRVSARVPQIIPVDSGFVSNGEFEVWSTSSGSRVLWIIVQVTIWRTLILSSWGCLEIEDFYATREIRFKVEIVKYVIRILGSQYIRISFLIGLCIIGLVYY